MRRFKPNNVPIPTRHALSAIIATLLDAVFGNFSPCTAGFCYFFLVAAFFVVLVLLPFPFLTLLLSLYCFFFFAISFLAVLALFSFLFFNFLLFLNRGFFFALSCCSCVASSFVTVPVSALATEEYPTVKSAIAQIGNSFFSFYFSPFIRFTSLRIGCITRINKRYKYKMQMKYISFKDFIVKKKHRNIYDVFRCVSQYLHVTFA